jgi:pimeloyl-ACP methyl ester carboxylesterase
VALDLTGHRESPWRDPYDLREVADVLHEAVDAAGARRPVLVGHSIGGVLATVYAANTSLQVPWRVSADTHAMAPPTCSGTPSKPETYPPPGT